MCLFVHMPRTAVWPNLHTCLAVYMFMCVCSSGRPLGATQGHSPLDELQLKLCVPQSRCRVITPACDRQLRVAHTVATRRGRVTDTVDKHTELVCIHIHSWTPSAAYFVIFCISFINELRPEIYGACLVVSSISDDACLHCGHGTVGTASSWRQAGVKGFVGTPKGYSHVAAV